MFSGRAIGREFDSLLPKVRTSRFPNCGSAPRDMLAFGGRGTERDIIEPRSTAIAELGRFIAGCSVLPNVGEDGPWNPARSPLLMDARVMVGRAKLRAGGVIRARDAPSTAELPGRALNERRGSTRFIWLGETRIMLRPTCCPLTSVLRETAVKPLGRRIFANPPFGITGRPCR